MTMTPTKLWTCPKCKGAFPYDQPMILDGCTGYSTSAHDCGEGFTAMTLRPASKDARAFWARVADLVRGT